MLHGNCGGMFGFVSSHASNSAAFALLTFLLLRRKYIFWMVTVYALLVGYSRIYLGVHFPFDILFGFLNGLFCGGLVYWGYKKINTIILIEKD
jgi:undecaprenyl-diphosphatase